MQSSVKRFKLDLVLVVLKSSRTQVALCQIIQQSNKDVASSQDDEEQGVFKLFTASVDRWSPVSGSEEVTGS